MTTDTLTTTAEPVIEPDEGVWGKLRPAYRGQTILEWRPILFHRVPGGLRWEGPPVSWRSPYDEGLIVDEQQVMIPGYGIASCTLDQVYRTRGRGTTVTFWPPLIISLSADG